MSSATLCPQWLSRRSICYCYLGSVFAAVLFVSTAHAQTWDGGGVAGGSTNWNNAANWNPDGVPVSNGTANIFMVGAIDVANTVDINFDIGSLTFNSTAGAFIISGSGGSTLTIRSGGVVNNDVDTQTLNVPIILDATQVWNAVSGVIALGASGSLNIGANQLTLNGNNGFNFAAPISGTGTMNKSGTGTATFSGTTANTFTGTTNVNAGTLQLNKSANVNAISGPLVVGDGSGTDRVNIVAAEQIADSVSVTVNSGAILTVDHVTETIGPLTLDGGTVAITSSGTLKLTSTVTTLADTIASQINGDATRPLDLGGAARTFDVANGAAITDLEISEVVANGSIVKTGGGTMRLSGASANTASGVTVNDGTLALAKSVGVNAVSGAVTIGDDVGAVDSDVLRLDQSNQIAQVAADTLTINSTGLLDLTTFSEGLANVQLNGGHIAGGTVSFTGSVTSSAQPTSAAIDSTIDLLAATTSFTVNDGAASDDLIVRGVVQNGSFQKLGPGTMRLAGTTANTASITQVAAGTLVLDKPTGVNALAGTNVTVGDGTGGPLADVLRYGSNDNQLADTVTVTVNSSGLFDLADRSDTIGTLTISGSGAIETGTGALTVATAVSSSAAATAGTISGNLNLGGDSLPFTIADGAPATDLTVAAKMSNGTLLKQGAGTLALTDAALNSTSSYQLDAGTLNAAGLTVAVGRTFTQNAGTFIGQLKNFGTFKYNSGSFQGEIVNSGALEFHADFSSSDGLTNHASLTVPAGFTLTLDSGGLINSPTGTVTIQGGTLTGSGPTTNQGLISGNGSFAGTGGFHNTGQVIISDGAVTLSNTGTNTNAGTIAAGLSQSLILDASLANTGLVLLAGGSVAGSSTLTNSTSGEIRGVGSVLAPLASDGGLIHSTGTGTLTIANFVGANTNGAELRADDGSAINVSAAFSSNGTIVVVGPNSQILGGTISNMGTIRGQGRVSNVVINSGTVRAEGGTLTLAALGSSNGVGARIESATGTQVIFSRGLTTNSGQIVLTGGAFDNNNFALANAGSIDGTGSLRIGGLVNTGSINASGSLDVFGPVTNSGVVNVQPGATARFFGPVSGPGNYTGPGTTSFQNSFSPGASAAQVNFGGDLVFGGGASLAIEIGGASPGTQFDRLNVVGTATLAGALNISLLNGFTPTLGSSFQIIAATGGIVGTFSSTSFPAIGGGRGWNVVYSTGGVSLQVVSISVPGDYNNNGVVDAADYVLWRNGGPLQNEVATPGSVTQQDYVEWRARFGNSAGRGSGQAIAAAVPEPATWLLIVTACLTLGNRARRLRNGQDFIPLAVSAETFSFNPEPAATGLCSNASVAVGSRLNDSFAPARSYN